MPRVVPVAAGAFFTLAAVTLVFAWQAASWVGVLVGYSGLVWAAVGFGLLYLSPGCRRFVVLLSALGIVALPIVFGLLLPGVGTVAGIPIPDDGSRVAGLLCSALGFLVCSWLYVSMRRLAVREAFTPVARQNIVI